MWKHTIRAPSRVHCPTRPDSSDNAGVVTLQSVPLCPSPPPAPPPPARSRPAGGIANPDRSPEDKVVQWPDRMRFTMEPGRGEGLSYRLVVKDLVR